jgi:bla regulator protein BlaR1
MSTLLLPTHYAESLSDEEAEHVLLHGLAHIKRGDLWVNGLCLALQVIYWFNPLIAWARRQMKHVRELCRDLNVAKLLRGLTARYRKTLLDTARELLTETVEPGMGLLGVFEPPEG